MVVAGRTLRLTTTLEHLVAGYQRPFLPDIRYERLFRLFVLSLVVVGFSPSLGKSSAAISFYAVWIVHGLPVTLLERIEEYRAQYENRFDFNVREEFHLSPEWKDLPEITPENDEPMRRPTTLPRIETIRPESPAREASPREAFPRRP